MSEPLFDQSFYDYFAQHSQTRLQQALSNLEQYRRGQMEYLPLVDYLRHLFHNVAGEARMLDLPDVGRLVLRLGHRLGRMNSTPTTAMGPEATQHMINCCELLMALVHAAVLQHDRSVVMPRQALMQEIMKLEATV